MRNELFTAEIKHKILAQIRLCVPMTVAAEAAGVPQQTFSSWRNRAKKYRKNPERWADYVHFDLFDQEVVKARAIACSSMVQELRTGKRKETLDVNGDKRDIEVDSSPLSDNYKWLLARSFREHFGTGQEKGEVSGPNGAPIAVKHSGNVHILLPAETDE
jgi:hypothetical protein